MAEEENYDYTITEMFLENFQNPLGDEPFIEEGAESFGKLFQFKEAVTHWTFGVNKYKNFVFLPELSNGNVQGKITSKIRTSRRWDVQTQRTQRTRGPPSAVRRLSVGRPIGRDDGRVHSGRIVGRTGRRSDGSSVGRIVDRSFDNASYEFFFPIQCSNCPKI